MQRMARWSTGIPGLDKVIDGLRMGDNVVWQVDTIDDYRRIVTPWVAHALDEGKRVVYMRFALHKPLLQNDERVIVYNLDAYSGFEHFSSQAYSIVSSEGEDVFYVFDCLSDLLSAWATDLMIGNFFFITCPYLFELNTIAYFSILRKSHSFRTVARIRETTQLLIDIYNCNETYYIHPLKAWNRYSPTMFFPHAMNNETMTPVTSSLDMAKLFDHIPKTTLDKEKRNLDYWDRLFLSAVDLYRQIQQGNSEAIEKEKETIEHVCKLIVGRDERILDLANRVFSIQDLLTIKSRMIGSGYIGGKAAGMLIARTILRTDPQFDWDSWLEPHDSYYIGSDVFYTYIVQNGWWKLRMKQKKKEHYFEVAAELREKIANGLFPDDIKEQFQQMLEYFGQSPIIVRSSSLLEDAFGNSFSGKYESIFCVNQGTPEQRYTQFEDAVRRVFASTMDEDALAYRLERGLDQRDEQMAILVQRVSGSYHDQYFYPDLAGVGISYNTYVWSKGMDPQAGMLRLVYGLGTRAVDRVEDDYPRIVALDAPLSQPHQGRDDIRRFSQREVDLLNIEQNQWQTMPVRNIAGIGEQHILKLIGIRDHETETRMRELGMGNIPSWILNFEKLLRDTPFPKIMGRMLTRLEEIYNYPVDIEFTANFTHSNNPRINLLQCRPLQTKGLGNKVSIPKHIEPQNLVFTSQGSFMGGNICETVGKIVYVVPEQYSRLTNSQKYEVARTIGVLNRQILKEDGQSFMLIGPGRWGTTTPSLGVPVTFAEINNVSILVELSFSSAGLVPELSFGTHFFQDLVERGIFYVALFSEENKAVFNSKILEIMSNQLSQLAPGKSQFDSVIRVLDVQNEGIMLMADVISQKVVCFFKQNFRQ